MSRRRSSMRASSFSKRVAVRLSGDAEPRRGVASPRRGVSGRTSEASTWALVASASAAGQPADLADGFAHGGFFRLDAFAGRGPVEVMAQGLPPRAPCRKDPYSGGPGALGASGFAAGRRVAPTDPAGVQDCFRPPSGAVPPRGAGSAVRRCRRRLPGCGGVPAAWRRRSRRSGLVARAPESVPQLRHPRRGGGCRGRGRPCR